MTTPFSPAAREKTGKARIVDTLSTVILFAGLWWVLSNGTEAAWLIGLPAVAGAVLARQRLGGPWVMRISLRGLIRFVPFFLWQSMRGGVDVALRTLAPRMRIRTDFHGYRTALNTSSARTLFVNCVSLLPGTLAADFDGEYLEVHVLNTDSDLDRELAALERVVARVFRDTGSER